MEVSGELQNPIQFSQGEVAISTHWMGGSVGIGASLDALENKATPLSLYNPSAHTLQITLSPIVKEVCLLVCYLVLDVLLSHAENETLITESFSVWFMKIFCNKTLIITVVRYFTKNHHS
jgi:hypothetical protein